MIFGLVFIASLLGKGSLFIFLPLKKGGTGGFERGQKCGTRRNPPQSPFFKGGGKMPPIAEICCQDRFKKFVLVILAFIILWASSVSAESSSKTSRFEKALAGYTFSFPRDHGSHPSYLIEWWYFTGNLQSQSGQAYGYELTFFRRGIENKFADENPSRWTVRDVYLAHFAVSDLSNKDFFYDEKISRAAIGKAGAKEGKMKVWIDQWSAVQEGEVIHLIAGKDDFEIALNLSPAKPLVIHGTDGISPKGDEIGEASHYYSFTRLATEGTLVANGEEVAVTGLSWMDHEFGSTLLGNDQVGWDWFSIQLDDGSDYMFYRIREKGGSKDAISSGTVIDPDGTARHLTAKAFTLTPLSTWKSQQSGAAYPLEWTISVPSEGLVLQSKPALDDQELMTKKSTRVTYWEGASRFSGEKRGKEVTGSGYIELTGYASKLKDSSGDSGLFLTNLRPSRQE